MKVELDDLELRISPATDEVFVGIIQKNNPHVWKHKKDVTNGFLACAVARWSGFEQEITGADGKKYSISVKEL